MNQIRIIITIFIILLSCSKEIILPQDIQEKVDQIADHNNYESSHIGAAGTKSKQYERYEYILEHSSLKQLIKLTSHRNAVVKAYVYQALIARKYKKIPQHFKRIIKSKTTIGTTSGCIMSTSKLYSEIYHSAFNATVLFAQTKNDSIFYKKLLEKLNAIVIESNIKENDYDDNWLILHRAFNSTNDYSKHFNKIYDRAINDGEQEALVALSRFKRKKDIPKIRKWKNQAFLAIAENPTPQYWELLLKQKKNYMNSDFNKRDYIKAVASFQNKNSAKLLSKILTEIKINSKDYEIENQLEILHKGIAQFKCDSYDNLLINLLQNEKIIDFYSYKYLKEKFPKKYTEIFSKSLMGKGQFNFTSYTYEYELQDSILVDIVSTLSVKLNKNEFIKILNYNIENANYLDIEIFANYIKEYHNEETIEIIFSNLRNEKVPFKIFHLCKAIRSLENDKYNQRLKDILELNKKWDVSNWSQKIRDLVY